MERGLVVVEVALAMLIASGAALLVRSVSNLYAIDPGITTEGLAVVGRRRQPARCPRTSACARSRSCSARSRRCPARAPWRRR
jgi:hypothetical protein